MSRVEVYHEPGCNNGPHLRLSMMSAGASAANLVAQPRIKSLAARLRHDALGPELQSRGLQEIASALRTQHYTRSAPGAVDTSVHISGFQSLQLQPGRCGPTKQWRIPACRFAARSIWIAVSPVASQWVRSFIA